MSQLDEFLQDIKTSDFSKYQIVQRCREIMRAAAPDMSERIIYGGVMFALKGDDIGGVFPSQKHVSFEFSNGFLFADPSGHLEGKGKYRRHLKLRSAEDIAAKDLAGFVKYTVA